LMTTMVVVMRLYCAHVWKLNHWSKKPCCCLWR
jgi:hypothetical protein